MRSPKYQYNLILLPPPLHNPIKPNETLRPKMFGDSASECNGFLRDFGMLVDELGSQIPRVMEGK